MELVGNPIHNTINFIVSYLTSRNFIPCLTNIITSKEDNFHLLGIGEEHIATSHKDTFVIDNKTILRTHTTNFQSRCFKKYGNDIKNKNETRFMNYGTVFRKDDSSRHSYFFHQIDGVICGKNVNYTDSIIFLSNLISSALNGQYQMRIRKSYFPFTNPSFEIDVLVGDEYIEVLGCGMTSLDIRKKFNIENINIFAFGMGVERIAAIRYHQLNIKILRLM